MAALRTILFGGGRCVGDGDEANSACLPVIQIQILILVVLPILFPIEIFLSVSLLEQYSAQFQASPGSVLGSGTGLELLSDRGRRR